VAQREFSTAVEIMKGGARRCGRWRNYSQTEGVNGRRLKSPVQGGRSRLNSFIFKKGIGLPNFAHKNTELADIQHKMCFSGEHDRGEGVRTVGDGRRGGSRKWRAKRGGGATGRKGNFHTGYSQPCANTFPGFPLACRVCVEVGEVSFENMPVG
jgi:hypothetical protein